jgi:glycosyltransferase involved in cell wall biosynthesis
MKQINVLFIENSVGLAGSTMSLCSLLNFLDTDLVEPHIVLSRSQQEAYLLGHLRRPGDMTVIAPSPRLNEASWAQRILSLVQRLAPSLRGSVLRVMAGLETFAVTIPYVFRIRRWAKDRHIALIHHNNGFDLGALLLSYVLRVPLVAYQRGDEWNSPLVRWLAPRVTRYIANSMGTKENLISIGVASGRISVIYPPLDLSVFDVGRPSTLTPSTFGVPAASPCFGIVGMLISWKGQDVFLRAAGRVLEQIPNAYVFVVGAAPPGDRAFAESLRALAVNLGIADRVVFTGFRSDVPDVLKLLDVVVHASVQKEPFGRVIAEAMVMGRPVVATNAGGPTEIIEDGETGFLVPPRDDEALAARIIALLQDPAMAKRIGEAGRQAVIEKFSAEDHARLVTQVYAKALGRRQSPIQTKQFSRHARQANRGRGEG